MLEPSTFFLEKNRTWHDLPLLSNGTWHAGMCLQLFQTWEIRMFCEFMVRRDLSFVEFYSNETWHDLHYFQIRNSCRKPY